MLILTLLGQGRYLETHWVREKSWREMEGSQVGMSPGYLCLRSWGIGYQRHYLGIVFRHVFLLHGLRSSEPQLLPCSALGVMFRTL